MRNIKMTIEYDGGRYQGWQRLGDSDKTIQGKIENILKQMTGETIEIIGSGRTDAGAHAHGQVANFKTASSMSFDEMLPFLHQYLPRDIVVTKLEEMPERFHARYNATGKKYTYHVLNSSMPSAFDYHYSYQYPQTLNIDAMKRACEKLEGTHDFIGFSSLKKSKKSTERTIRELSIQSNKDQLTFTFVGDGFLYKMVRIIMGTLLEIGTGELPVSIIDEIFEKKVRADAGATVPAQGLFLEEVYYKK